MSTPPSDDPGAVTQGGRTPRRGHSIWWIAMVLVVVAVVAAFALVGRRRSAPAETGTAPVAGGASGVAAPTPAPAAGPKG